MIEMTLYFNTYEYLCLPKSFSKKEVRLFITYALYRIVNYEFDHVTIFTKVFYMSPKRFLSWYDQLCPAELPAVVVVPQGSACLLY